MSEAQTISPIIENPESKEKQPFYVVRKGSSFRTGPIVGGPSEFDSLAYEPLLVQLRTPPTISDGYISFNVHVLGSLQKNTESKDKKQSSFFEEIGENDDDLPNWKDVTEQEITDHTTSQTGKNMWVYKRLPVKGKNNSGFL